LSSNWHLIVPNAILPWNIPMEIKPLSTKIMRLSRFYSSNFSLSSNLNLIIPNGMLPWNIPMKIKPLLTKIIFKMLLVCQSKQLYYAFKKS
jgi:hypothetical protein